MEGIMKITRFEDILAWHEARKLVKKVYLMAESNKQFNNDFRFKWQVTNAAISSMSNIAEGFSRQSDKEFAQFLFISKGSIAEVQSLLYVALDLEYISDRQFQETYKEADNTARLILKFITY